MKAGIGQIIGKTIAGVVAAKNGAHPRLQLFLIFSDGTSLEFYGDSFNCAGGLDKGGIAEAERYARKGGAVITDRYPDATSAL